jgi:hypothetical protein
MNAFLLSGVFFHAGAQDNLRTLTSIFRTLPVVISGVFLLAFVLVSATARWWASH